MPTKMGCIVRWGRRGSKFTEAFLQGGERVELSDQALAVVHAHDAAAVLVFVERRGRIFRYVQWVGTPEEAVRAAQDGTLRPDEIPERVGLLGNYLIRIQARAELDRARRIEETLRILRHELPDDCPTSIAAFARLTEAIAGATIDQILEIGSHYDAIIHDDGFFPAWDALSPTANRVGFTVRRVLYPNPIDPIENLEFRRRLPQAAFAIELAAAALAEPKVTTAQRSLLCGPISRVLDVQLPPCR
jgi:hypothetical protein